MDLGWSPVRHARVRVNLGERSGRERPRRPARAERRPLLRREEVVVVVEGAEQLSWCWVGVTSDW